MPAAVVIAALVIAGAITYPASIAGDLWTIAVVLTILGTTFAIAAGGDR